MISADMLQSFVKVAEEGNVSRAAAALGVGKSAVSKRVGQLEEALGASLFSRSTRKIALTPAGETYLDHAKRALAELASGEERLRSMREELTGRIRLTAPVSWGQRVLAKRLPEFLRLHPGVEIELLLADRLIDLAYERLDLALRWTASDAPELACEPVAAVGWVLAASPQHLASAGAPHAPEDLAARPCLCYWREAQDDVWTLASGDRRAQVRVRTRYKVDNAEAIADAALAGLGIAMLPDYLCDEALAAGRLTRVLPAWTPVTRFGTHVSAVAPPERMRLARNRALVDFLRADPVPR